MSTPPTIRNADFTRRPLLRGLLAAAFATVPKAMTVRGCYDGSGFRADADLMVWWTAEDPPSCRPDRRSCCPTAPAAG